MKPIASTTGHSPRGEQKIARILYTALAIAVVVGVLLFVLMGRKSEFNPYQSDQPNTAAPDVPAGENPRPLEAPAEPPPQQMNQ